MSSNLYSHSKRELSQPKPDAFDPLAVPLEQIPALIIALAARLVTTPTASTVPTEAPTADALLTADQVATRLNVSVKSVYRFLTKQAFACKIGGSWRFGEQGFERWLAKQRIS